MSGDTQDDLSFEGVLAKIERDRKNGIKIPLSPVGLDDLEIKKRHPTFAFRETMKEIKAMGIGEKEIKLVEAIGMLFEKHNSAMNDRMDSLEDRLKVLDKTSEPLFDEIETEIDAILSKMKRGDMSQKEVSAHLVKLIHAVESEAVDEAKAFSSEQLTQLHNAVVAPLKKSVVGSEKEIIDNLVQSHTVQVKGLDNVGGQIISAIQKAKQEILSGQHTTDYKIDSLQIKRKNI